MTGGTKGYIGHKFEHFVPHPTYGPGTRQTLRSSRTGLPQGFIPASINRHTGRPHEHKREIARRARQAGAL